MSVFAFAEAQQSGIFIVKKPGRRNPCEQELKMLIGGKKVCVLKKPIVDVEGLEYVTDILYDPIIKSNHINLGLSSTSVSTLNKTILSLPNAEFALVVDDDVICVFTIYERLTTRYIRIGSDLDIQSLFIVRDKLRKVRYE